MISFGKTDTGLVRQNNEDAIFVSNSQVGALPNLFIVADGMGGHKAGEVASNSSIVHFIDFINKTGSNLLNPEDFLDVLTDGIIYTNKCVHKLALESERTTGMGTTFSVAVVTKEKIFAAHIGDSRIYLIRNDSISQITTDHTYVNEMVKAGQITQEEAKVHPQRNVITRALGTNSSIDVDGIVKEVSAGDYILMCSDGLSNLVTDAQMLECAQEGNLEEICEKLVLTAKQHGGNDNISVVLILIDEVSA